MRRMILLTCFVLLFARELMQPMVADAQTQGYLTATGSPNFSVNIPVPNGYINIANGNLHLEISLATLKQRGNLQLNERLVYDSRIWKIVHYSHYYWWPLNVTNTPSVGWRYVQGNETGTFNESVIDDSDTICIDSNGNEGDQTTTNYGMTWTDPSGTVHTFDALFQTYQDTCAGTYTQGISGGYATDASGYQVKDDGNGNPIVTDSNGTEVYPVVADRFGNSWSSDSNGNLVDDLGRTPVIVTQNGNVTYYDVLAPNGPISNNGTRVRYTVTTEQVPINTEFGQQGVVEYQNNNGEPTAIPAIQSIQLPDGSVYQFGYDSYGEMTAMSLPTGGNITYGWTNYQDSYQNINRWVTSSTTSDGTTTYTPSVITQCSSNGTGCEEQVNYHRPSTDESVYTLTLDNGAWNTNTTIYSGPVTSNSPVISDATTYNFANVCNYTIVCQGAQYVTKSTETDTLLDASLSTQTQTSYANPETGQMTLLSQWDYYPTGSTPSTTPTRQTKYEYTNYDLTTEIQYDQTGNEASLATYAYTGTATTTSGIVGHGTTNAGGPYLTSATKYNLLLGNEIVTENFTYDDTGTVQTVQDYNGNTAATYKYDPTDTFAIETDKPSTTTLGTVYQHVTKASYDTNSGAVLSTDDENSVAHGQAYSVRYSYEPVAGRISSISFPDGGSQSYTYPTYTQTNETIAQNASTSITTTSIVDAYGRPYQVASGGISTERTYDANGRLYTVSNPHVIDGSPTAPTSGVTYTLYDTLDRITSIQQPDGKTISTKYNGNTAIKKDEIGNQTKYLYDVFGELASVFEDDPSTGALDLETDYQHDGLGNVICVEQHGNVSGTGCSAPSSSDASSPWRVRRFYYNELSQLAAASIPEHTFQPTHPTQQTCTTTTAQWTDCYSYDPNGNLVSVTDNAGTIRRYSYDALNRVIAETTPRLRASYYYDSGTNGVGRLWAEFGTPGPNSITNPASIYSYDVMGRNTSKSSCQPAKCPPVLQIASMVNTIGVSYDLVGNITQIKYPDGRVVQNSYNALNQLAGVTYLQWGTQSVGTNYWLSPSYAPAGELTAAQYGNGVQLQATFNSRQSITSLTYQSSGQSIFSKGYQWDANAANLLQETNNTTGVVRQFSYDTLNRLRTAQDLTSASGAFNQQYSLDAWGNLSQMGVTSGFSQPINNQNQVATYNYDAAGRLLSDGLNTYTYDNNGMLATSSDGESYVYDAEEQRVAVTTASGSTGYYYFGGTLIAKQNTSTGIWTDMIYAAGSQLIAEVAGTQSAAPVYTVTDHIGSEVATTDNTGVVISALDYTPFGQLLSGTNNDGFIFTGLQRDGTNLDHAQFRQYSSTTGRWSTSDPYDGSYLFDSPQSMNRYTYGLNNPLFYTDALGLQTPGCPECVATFYMNSGPNSYCGWTCSLGDIFLDLFDLFGSGPKFKGNVQAANQGKQVTQTPKRQLDPNNQECLALAQKIDNLVAQIQKRQNALDNNPNNLPLFAPGPLRNSVQGHQQLLNEYTQYLANAANEYNNKCGGGPPGSPSGAPSTAGSASPSIPPGALPAIIVGGGIVIGVLVCPECLVVAPAFAF